MLPYWDQHDTSKRYSCPQEIWRDWCADETKWQHIVSSQAKVHRSEIEHEELFCASWCVVCHTVQGPQIFLETDTHVYHFVQEAIFYMSILLVIKMILVLLIFKLDFYQNFQLPEKVTSNL